jgi:hypothetical protein
MTIRFITIYGYFKEYWVIISTSIKITVNYLECIVLLNVYQNLNLPSVFKLIPLLIELWYAVLVCVCL